MCETTPMNSSLHLLLNRDAPPFDRAEVRARLKPDLSESPEFSRELNRAWTRFRTGQ